MLDGWIKLHRSIESHWIFNDSDKLKAWLVILLSVNHSPQKVAIRGDLYECDIGQSLCSYETWAIKFGKKWTKQKVRTFFSLLEKDGMLTHEGLRYTTRVTVCNYKTYQEKVEPISSNLTHETTHGQHTSNTRVTHGQHTSNTRVTPNKNDKNDKNDNNGKNEKKNTYMAKPEIPSLTDVVEYCKERGYKTFDSQQYLSHRTAADWVNANGRKIVNWKLDIISAQTFGNFQRAKTPDELEYEAMNAFALSCAKSVKAG